MPKQELSNTQKKERAQQLYLQDQHTQKEIAQKVGVSQQTMVKWATDGKWDEKRKSLMVTTEEILRDLIDTLDHMRKEAKTAATDNDPSTKPDSDGIYKMTLAIRKLQDKSGLGDIIIIMQQFIKFVQLEDHALSQSITKWADLFIKSKLKSALDGKR